MKKNRRFDCFTFECCSQVLLKVKLLSVVLVTAFASLAADGRLLETKPVFTANPAEQQKKITGKVSDVAGVPIPGATVVASGTTIGTTTDIDGNFTISVPAGTKTLLVSFVGMVSKELTIGTNNNFRITLSESSVGLEEVVIVGYGTQKKESVVGAITQVNNQSLMRSGTSNVTNAITGKLSGVLTIQQTGEPGASNSEIVIRGLSSWNGSAPLVLVDGVERDFNSLDPNEVDKISVLKDASATAVFGARGANGVIIVSTKRGKIGKPVLDFSASYGIQKATRIPDHIHSNTTMSMYNVGLMNGAKFQDLLPKSTLDQYANPSTPLNALRYPNVNWFDEVTRPYAPTINANFNVSGGTNFVKYFCSLGYLYEGDFFNAKQDGFYDLSYKYNRFNYRTNVDFQLTPTTTLSFNLGGQTGIKNSPNSNPWRNLYSTGPARYPAYFPAWVLDQVPDPTYPGDSGIRLAANFGEYTGNPYNSLHTGQFNQDLNTKLFTDVLINQKLDFITKGLSFAGKAALSTYYVNRILTANWTSPEYQLNYDDIGKPGVNPWNRITSAGNEYYKQQPLDINVGSMQGGYYRDLYYEFGLNYDNTFGKHSVTGLALMNRQQKNDVTDFPYFNEGLVGRATYDYDHRYLLEFNVGYTGSERFAPGNRFGFFPSGAIGWVISEERFFKNAIPWINKMKLRYSDGLTGSDNAANRWLYNSGYYSDNAGSPGPYLHEDLGANTTAQWEQARKRDIGLELEFFKGQLKINADLFDEQRDKMLLTPRSVTMLVGNSFKDLNLGKLKKHGLELEVEYNHTTPTKLNYWIKGIFGYNENRIIFKDDPPYAPDYTKDAGKPLGAQLNGVLLTGTGYYTSVDDIHNNPSPIDLYKVNVGDYKFLDYRVDGKITSLDKYPIAGSTFPPITYSLSGGIVWNKFEINFMFQGNQGKYVEYNQTYEVEFIKGDWRVHSSQLDYWAPNNPDANHSTLHYSGSSSADILFWGGGEADRGYQIAVENRFWRKADYLRLKEIYLGYNLSSKLLSRLAGVSNLTVYGSGNNLWTLTNLIEGDPERKDFQQGFYPQMTVVKFGVKVNF
ncbi:MAG: TonB-dependent receptor [Prolixibacteraceae bacterium]|nr:TonB-dependent receptor [Prolixibacteraceae bacterium]